MRGRRKGRVDMRSRYMRQVAGGILWTVFIMVAMGCRNGDVAVTVRFDHLDGLVQGDRVLFENNHVGTVEKVSYTRQGRYLVRVVLFRDFAAAARSTSRFTIMGDRGIEGRKAVEVVNDSKGGALLEDGAVVEGREPPGIMDTVREHMDKGIEGLRKQLERFSDDVRRLPETDEFKRMEKELEEFARKMKKSGEEARQYMKDELLPRLKEDMERLRRELEKLGREDEVTPLETQLEKMREI